MKKIFLIIILSLTINLTFVNAQNIEVSSNIYKEETTIHIFIDSFTNISSIDVFFHYKWKDSSYFTGIK